MTYQQLSPVLQETEVVQFVVLKIPDYKESEVEKIIWDNHVMILHKTEQSVQWAHIYIDHAIDNSLSHFSLVKDYVVANLPKGDKAFWDKQGVSEVTSSYEAFQTQFSQLLALRGEQKTEVKETVVE